MTKKHYKAIAEAVLVLKGLVPETSLRVIAYELASKVGPFNPRFDRSKFLKACGV